MQNVKKTSWIWLFALVAFSCLDQPDCYNLTNNTVGIAFKKIHDGKLDTIFAVRGSIAGIATTSAKVSSASSVFFPLDYTKDITSFSIKDTLRERTLDVGYFVQTQFVSEACGPRFILSNLTAKSNTGDSVRVTSSTPGGGTNIDIYRCPRENVVRLAFQKSTAGIITSTAWKITETKSSANVFSFYPTTGTLNYINIPLNLKSTSTQVTILQENTTTPITLNFSYQLVKKTVYKVCGEQTFIHNLVLTSPDLGNIQLIKSTRYKADSIYDPPKINFAIIQ